jgi:hypothetical protein
MTRSIPGATTPRRPWRPFAIVAVVAGSLLAAPAAFAADGSTPVEVTNFIASGLMAQLEDVYGGGTGSHALTLDNSTTFSNTTRIFAFTDSFVHGDARAIAARRLNEWISVVSTAKKPVGVATVVLSQEISAPGLSNFEPDLALAGALPRLAPTARLVRDDAHHAWFSFDGSVLTPIVTGDSGISGAVTLAKYLGEVHAAPVHPAIRTGVDAGVLVGASTILVTMIAVVVALVMLRRARAHAAAHSTPDP